MVSPDNKELFNAELEIEELAMQLADMLGAALYFAGISKDRMQEGVDAYLNMLDELYDDNTEYGFEEIVNVVQHLKKERSELFES